VQRELKSTANKLVHFRVTSHSTEWKPPAAGIELASYDFLHAASMSGQQRHSFTFS